MRISIQLIQDLDTRIWKITSCVNVTIFLILEKENSIETDMYIIWTIMYDYKLASISRIIGVMRSRLTDAYGKPQNLDSPDRHYLKDSRYVRSLHLLDERNVPRLKALSFHRFPIQFRKGESLPFSRNPRIEI